MSSGSACFLRGETFDLRLFCFADCATVEERPFQGRVRRRARMRALAPVVVFLCSSEDGSRGLSPQLQKTLDAALEAPLFHGAACVRGGFHQRRFSTVLLTFVGIAESIIPLHRVEMTSYFIPILRLLFSSGDEHHNRFAPHNVTIPDMDWQRTFFITAVTWGRMPIFRVEDRARLLIDVLFDYRGQGKFLLHEFVVMPDHFHALLTPAAEIALERAVQFIKGGYSYRLRKMENIQVWQESFTNHRIRDAEDHQRHCEYIRMNPVRANLVREATEYPYSSANPAFGEIDRPAGAEARDQRIQLTRR